MKRRIGTAPGLGLALFTFLSAGCRDDAARVPPAVHDVVADSTAPAPLTEAASAWLDDVRRTEAGLIAGAAGTAVRSGWNVLEVRAGNGTTQRFIDVVQGDDVVRVHVYRGYIASIAQHVVEVIEVPEGGTFMMVDGRAGNRWEVDGPPVPSPDGTRIITASLDLVAGHRPNRIRIYRLVPGRLVVEWETSPRDWGGTAPLWLDSGAIRIDRAMIDSTTTPFTVRTSPMRIERDSGSWRIVP